MLYEQKPNYTPNNPNQIENSSENKSQDRDILALVKDESSSPDNHDSPNSPNSPNELYQDTGLYRLNIAPGNPNNPKYP